MLLKSPPLNLQAASAPVSTPPIIRCAHWP